jgi:hypothetical protein
MAAPGAALAMRARIDSPGFPRISDSRSFSCAAAPASIVSVAAMPGVDAGIRNATAKAVRIMSLSLAPDDDALVSLSQPVHAKV